MESQVIVIAADILVVLAVVQHPNGFWFGERQISGPNIADSDQAQRHGYKMHVIYKERLNQPYSWRFSVALPVHLT